MEARQEEKGNHTKKAALSPSAPNQLCHSLHRDGAPRGEGQLAFTIK